MLRIMYIMSSQVAALGYACLNALTIFNSVKNSVKSNIALK